MAEQAIQNFNYVDAIWNIADYVRDIIKRSEYNRLVLPFSLLRRLECALEPTRDAVVEAVKKHEADWSRESDNYCAFSKKAFYNVTNFRLNNLGAVDTLAALMEYINGFSPNARDILLRFKIEETCKTLQEHGMLYEVCMRFSQFDLSAENVSDREMSDIYEHLIQRYGEQVAEDAEDFMTPKDVVRLAVSMIFANDDELMNSDQGIVRTLYDPTMGTGGFITDALDLLDEWHKDKKMTAPAVIVPYGEECEQESWAMGKANLLLRNAANNDKDEYDSIKDMSSHIMYGDTLSDDKFEGMTFNYQLSNPPYGKKWEKQASAVNDEARLGFNGRFGAGLPSISDGSMLFLQHVVSKLAPISAGGGKAGIVLSASPLFNGDAGSGPSNIRRWLFEKDFIDCIVKLPESIFFRTGINTYLWILSNNKPVKRKKQIQLIDASEMKTSLRKNLGNKRYEISPEDRDWIVKTYIDGHDHGKSVMVPYTDFMFRKVTTQQPLHAAIQFDLNRMDEFFGLKPMTKLSDNNKEILWQQIKTEHLSALGETVPYETAEAIAKSTRKLMDKPEVTAAVITKSILDTFTVKDKKYPIIKDNKGNVVYDPDLKDSENIPWDMNFNDYMEKEVLPFTPETVIDETVTDVGPLQDGKVGVVGTNISFNRYFYHYEAPREPKIIANEILELEKGLENFLEGFLK
ncbi:type I restriction-modification system subunit M [Lacrimispora sp.]|uniref:type I restriction-modification system subunit M n=1 Tax=Lacrimispora sp. TaxID=2719234 RepID=UPI0028595254|nr:class I SAM-dependent DNA methyltransferase [Lacrimispora sp.]MDR7812376.1 class I SAM-dependent DNA methyltransferase [Lacrimispora sp.]